MALLAASPVLVQLSAPSEPRAAEPSTPAKPEAASGVSAIRTATARRRIVVAANPLAAEAGFKMLAAGGSAADAAVAVQLVLGLVEPQSSGVGGGAFIVGYDAGSKALTAIDGRETAPAAATGDRFRPGGRPLPFRRAQISGLSIGVPGAIAALEALHAKSGRLPWARLFEPALKLAREGFNVSPRLHRLLELEPPDAFAPEARAYFYDANGAPWPVGHLLQNPAYAATLEALAQKGAEALREGPVAEAILKAARAAPFVPSDLTAFDLKAYRAIVREARCSTYRGHRLCGIGAPSSGLLAVGETLHMLERFDLGHDPGAAQRPDVEHLIAAAERLAYADRNRYVGDPAFVPEPTGLIDPAYGAERSLLIDPWRTRYPAAPGIPPGLKRAAYGPDRTTEAHGTSHVSIVDQDGNAVAMTTTIESAFGSHVMAGGFLLNNELTDFSSDPGSPAAPVANAVSGGKRPRSSMTPLLMFGPDGRLEAVLGSPGGSEIILYVVKTVIALVDWHADAGRAAALANLGSLGERVILERAPEGTFAPTRAYRETWQALGARAFGERPRFQDMTSGLSVIRVAGDRLEGGADPRREGLAVGD